MADTSGLADWANSGPDSLEMGARLLKSGRLSFQSVSIIISTEIIVLKQKFPYFSVLISFWAGSDSVIAQESDYLQ